MSPVLQFDTFSRKCATRFRNVQDNTYFMTLYQNAILEIQRLTGKVVKIIQNYYDVFVLNTLLYIILRYTCYQYSHKLWSDLKYLMNTHFFVELSCFV